LDGLSNLNSLCNNLIILDNNQLTDIDGLSNISFFSGFSIQISNNNQLALCSNDFICNYVLDNNNFNTTTVSNNDPGCNEEAEIITGCNNEIVEIADCDDLVETSNIINFNITISPNPFINQISIDKSNNQTFNYQLLDLTGRVLSNGILVQQNNHLDFNNLKNGIYFFKIIDPETRAFSIEKVIKM